MRVPRRVTWLAHRFFQVMTGSGTVRVSSLYLCESCIIKHGLWGAFPLHVPEDRHGGLLTAVSQLLWEG